MLVWNVCFNYRQLPAIFPTIFIQDGNISFNVTLLLPGKGNGTLLYRRRFNSFIGNDYRFYQSIFIEIHVLDTRDPRIAVCLS